MPVCDHTYATFLAASPAFLNEDLEEEIYINLPDGFIENGQEENVHKLLTSLYGLKQASKQCHRKFDKIRTSSEFVVNEVNKFINHQSRGTGSVILCLYVDDTLFF